MVELITYADVQSAYRTEGKISTLVEIPKDFYEQAMQLISKVEPEHSQHILKFVGEIYIKRRNKIVLHALRVCDKSNPPLNATLSEKKLYSDIVDLLQENSTSTLSRNTEKKADGGGPNEEAKIKVRILKPMPAIVGSDFNNYGPFKEDDVLELPESNALLLIKNSFAEEFKETPSPAQED